jgi:hypothetical protein
MRLLEMHLVKSIALSFFHLQFGAIVGVFKPGLILMSPFPASFSGREGAEIKLNKKIK